MTHEEMSEMYELYALGVLAADEKIEIDEHLAQGCTECGNGLKRAIEVNAMFLTLPQQVKPPKRLRRRVVASIAADSNPRRWTLGWAVAACCLAIALAVVGVKMYADWRTSNAQLTELRNELRASDGQLSKMHEIMEFLNEPQTVQATFGGSQPAPPRGRVFVNPNRGVLLIASNLPPAPAGKIYQMWVVPKTGAPVPSGLFQSDAQGNAIHLLSGPVDTAHTAAIAVSVEPSAGSSAPSTTPIIVAGLSD
jgi:anti-sigma-K factor RskA